MSLEGRNSFNSLVGAALTLVTALGSAGCSVVNEDAPSLSIAIEQPLTVAADGNSSIDDCTKDGYIVEVFNEKKIENAFADPENSFVYGMSSSYDEAGMPISVSGLAIRWTGPDSLLAVTSDNPTIVQNHQLDTPSTSDARASWSMKDENGNSILISIISPRDTNPDYMDRNYTIIADCVMPAVKTDNVAHTVQDL